MDSAPWRIFQYNGSDVMIDVDGGITIQGERKKPFPCEITHAAICERGLIATWVDHDLRLARMALLNIDEPLKNGISKADLRLNRNTAMVESSKWCHIVDAEPLALTSDGQKIIFALWTRGIYCIDSSDNEMWRQPLFDSKEKSPPRSNDIAEISIVGKEVFVWTRSGKFRKLCLESGEILNEGTIDVECDLERVFHHGQKFLLSSKDGWTWELENEEITVARKLRGTAQDAVFDKTDWRIISWREDIMLRGNSVPRRDLGVQLVEKDGVWMVLDNQGEYTPHMISSDQ